jgi:uncharacterized membrane protein
MHPLAEDYWNRLESAAATLPAQDRDELLAELRSHLETGLEVAATDSDVRNFLIDLGRPEDIVAAAQAQIYAVEPEPTDEPSPGRSATGNAWGGLEIGALLALTAGAFLLPVIGPIIGIVLVWASAQWTRREKRVATFVAVFPVLFIVLSFLALTSIGGVEPSGSDVQIVPPTVPSQSASPQPSTGGS